MSADARAIELAQIAARAAAAKLGQDIIALDISERLAITDVFLIVSGANEPQVGAIVDHIDEVLGRLGVRAARREGEREGRWVLLDYLDLVVHVQHAEERTLYSLERLWKDAPRLALDLDGPLPSRPPRR